MRYRMVHGQRGAELALLDDAGELRAMGGVWAGLAERSGLDPDRPTLDELLAFPEPRETSWTLEAAFQEGKPLPADTPALVPLRGGDLVCVGRNYAAHAEELGNEVPGEPLIFMKPRTCLIAPGDEIVLPEDLDEVNYEGELALVIGKRLRGRVSPEQAREAIYGVTLMNDLTDRDRQTELREAGKPWLLAKGRAGFAPLGPNVRRLEPDEPIDSLELTTHVNGELRQEATPALWLFPLPVLIDFLSRNTGLNPGDIVSTGTPKGVGGITFGDSVTVSCPAVGELANRVAVR